MLPEDGDEHEDGGDEDQGQGGLRDGPRWEGLDVADGVFVVGLFVPAGEGGEQEEADEGEDDGDDSVRVRRVSVLFGSLDRVRGREEGKGRRQWGGLGRERERTYIK